MNIETANRLVSLRKQYNFSQDELAERLGVTRQAISRWERGEASPETDNLIGLSKIYGVSVDSLLALENGAGSPPVGRAREQPLQSAGKPEPAAAETVDKGPDNVFANRLVHAYPAIVTLIYLILGFGFQLWHPGWILFLTIPIVYALFGINEKQTRDKDDKN